MRPGEIDRYKNDKKTFYGYIARGAGLVRTIDDGTIAPTAAASSIAFVPELAIPAIAEMKSRWGDNVYGKYGFVDAFNPSFTFTDRPLRTGKVVPDVGWFDTMYLGIDQGPDHRDDRKLPQRFRLENHAQESVHPRWPEEGRLHRRMDRPAHHADEKMTTARRMRNILIACAGLLLAACASKNPDQVTLKFWTIGREGEVVQQLLPGFLRTHPNVRIDIQQIPLTAAHEKLLTAFAGDALPDMAQLGNTWIPEFVSVGALESLQDDVEKSAVIDAKDYFPGIWDTNVIDGTLYGVPWYVDTRLIFYRTDLLAEAGFPNPPNTWDEWAQQMAAVKAKQGSGQVRDFFPAQRIRAAAQSRTATNRSAAERQRHARQFPKRRFSSLDGVLRTGVPQRLGAEDEQHGIAQHLGRTRARLRHVLRQRAVEYRRIRTPRAEPERPLEHGAAARPERTRRRRGRRIEFRHFPQFQK